MNKMSFLLPEYETKDVGNMGSWEWLFSLVNNLLLSVCRVERGTEDDALENMHKVTCFGRSAWKV